MLEGVVSVPVCLPPRLPWLFPVPVGLFPAAGPADRPDRPLPVRAGWSREEQETEEPSELLSVCVGLVVSVLPVCRPGWVMRFPYMGWLAYAVCVFCMRVGSAARAGV